MHAGYSTLTLGVLPVEPEGERQTAAGLDPGPIEETAGYFISRDPDQNEVVVASARRS